MTILRKYLILNHLGAVVGEIQSIRDMTEDRNSPVYEYAATLSGVSGIYLRDLGYTSKEVPRRSYHAVRKVSWDELWHGMYNENGAEVWDRMPECYAIWLSTRLVTDSRLK